jgi:hypothetical protein
MEVKKKPQSTVQLFGRKVRRWTMIFMLAGIVIVLVYVGDFFFSWAGFAGKTIWDWLDLLIVPLVLSVTAFLLNRSLKENEQLIAEDNFLEAELQSYFESISKWLFEYDLRNASPDSDVGLMSRALTLRAFRRLDDQRKKALLIFLCEADLITGDAPVISLKDADLQGLDLAGEYLSGINLREVKLERVDFSGAILVDANFDYAHLSKTNLRKSNLRGAFLNFADLRQADLKGTDLKNAELYKADLKQADLRGADFSEADLSFADLSGTTVDDFAQFEKASNLDHTILPDRLQDHSRG